MKTSWFNRKPGHKGFKVTRGKLNASRKTRRDQGQEKTPSTSRCAVMFSQAMMLRWEADGPVTCVKCGFASDVNGLGPLQVSHFFNVRKTPVRFDPDNVDPLHLVCHTGAGGWEFKKKTEYRAYMLSKLGETSFAMLEIRSMQHMSLDVAKAEFIGRLRGGTL